MAVDLKNFEKDNNLAFINKDLLREAFIHRSYLNEHKGLNLPHNERLEFLGDAVLELVVTDYLFKTYADKPEGELTAVRAALVNAVTCADAARDLSVNDYLLLSKGEAKDMGRARDIILANAFEAIVGAIYLDQGYGRAHDFIMQTILVRSDEIVRKSLWRDPKSLFQEKIQESRGVTPTYKILAEEGPDHNKRFTVGLYVGSEEISQGVGHSKQEAEAGAARNGLKVLGFEK